MGLMTTVFENGHGDFSTVLAASETLAALVIDVRSRTWYIRANFRRF